MMQNGSLIKGHGKFLIQQINDNKGIIAYCEEKMNSDIAAWEKKEYAAVKKAAEKSLAKAEENLANLENYA
ncbi:hypothetical protein E_014 [Cronobacter phage vB_CsaM_leE]|uniref:Uncharacterized protein n=5 Tax=Pseudotevenvirus TaxID=2842979 RepID=A0A8E7FM40_9CAUD|nr:hypothetical protein HWB00_gp014 [Cronobacter phage vB_CsaM_leB]YP_009831310.1 hypothetical protein HWB01_gp014 [Cronobacter phage vB_CsaM_leE]AOG16420.1 hypothetical protein N_014 [Cronobacter phage vB_CsaM_leN]QPX73383.1 hypothetical protein [Cronobacter phage vB_CsaM_Cronuts]QVW27248.1 hypothetical protein AKFOPBLP_00026 [Cronobacter phage JC03]BCM29338.1 hypothetical protein NCT2020_0810 [Enterobacter phage vB_EkoM5VN]AOG16140.1 hypothetical protein B_014 [Cronobacter phage vB_CsaM_leB